MELSICVYFFSATMQCIAAGSHILNHELESEELRPFAIELSKTIHNVRVAIREQCLTDRETYSQKVYTCTYNTIGRYSIGNTIETSHLTVFSRLLSWLWGSFEGHSSGLCIVMCEDVWGTSDRDVSKMCEVEVGGRTSNNLVRHTTLYETTYINLDCIHMGWYCTKVHHSSLGYAKVYYMPTPHLSTYYSYVRDLPIVWFIVHPHTHTHTHTLSP